MHEKYDWTKLSINLTKYKLTIIKSLSLFILTFWLSIVGYNIMCSTRNYVIIMSQLTGADLRVIITNNNILARSRYVWVRQPEIEKNR